MKQNHTYTVCGCNRLFSEETLHPLVSVISLKDRCAEQRIRTDCYAVTLAGCLSETAGHGRRGCDYTESVMLFGLPGMDVCREGLTEGRLLLFHPDLIRCTCLGQGIAGYTYFNYNRDEALHLSCREERQAARCMDYIEEELKWGVDRFSNTLICNKIEILLNYCLRFYARQFITRHDEGLKTVRDVTRMADEYMLAGRARDGRLPAAADIAAVTGLSEAYLDDVLRHETGLSMAEFAALRRMAMAKRMLLGTATPVEEIAATLGFHSPECFAKLFARVAGVGPEDYRRG